MTNIITPVGAASDRVYTEAQFTLGARAEDTAGGVFVFCSFAAASTAKNAVSIDEAFAAADLTTAGVAGEDGQPCGIVQATMAAGEWGWVRIYGAETGVNVATAAAANAVLNTTATAGRLDDDQTVGSFDIVGMVLTAAEAANVAPAFLSYPTVAAAAN